MLPIELELLLLERDISVTRSRAIVRKRLWKYIEKIYFWSFEPHREREAYIRCVFTTGCGIDYDDTSAARFIYGSYIVVSGEWQEIGLW